MPHILIVSATFYRDLADALLKGCVAELEKVGATYEAITVPGAFEIPAAISMAHQTNKYDGYVALGCVIRGETTHYDYVCLESARGLNDLAVREHAAIGYGILTTENKHQALERALPDRGNKGAFAAHACLTMIALKEKFDA
ncbi:MAG: 6,7-dimethyl-8-ribityllumazine synthase [Rickettsiales bacterium]